jgi:putative nucleotidyltransferase with HDIG domain
MKEEKIITQESDRIQAIAFYAKQRLEADAAHYGVESRWLEYRWLHTLRVANIGRLLANQEGGDVEVVLAACLLHDIAALRPENPDDRFDHGRVGAQLIRPELPGLGFTPEETDNICYSVAVHADGNAGYDFPETLEAKIVTDADNVDRFDAYRMLEYCQPFMDGFEALAGAVKGRLERLEDYRQRRVMETESGHTLFNQKLDLQIMVYKALLKQHEISRLP